MKKLSNAETELKKSVAYKKKRVFADGISLFFVLKISVKLGLLYSPNPDPDVDSRKNWTPDIRPQEKPDRKYLENSDPR